MKPKYYLLSFAVSGIKNIEKEIKLEFYNRTIDKNFDPKKYRIKAIYGENGSGKTAIISAVKILRQIIISDSYLGDSSNQKKLFELINKKTECLKIQAEFAGKPDDSSKLNVFKYEVEIALKKDGKYSLVREALYKKSGGYSSAKYRQLFECNKEIISYADLNDEELVVVKEKSSNLLNNSSLVNICLRRVLDKTSVLNDFYLGILNVFFFATELYVSIEEKDQHDMYFIREEFKKAIENDDFYDAWKKTITQMDLIVSDGSKSVWKKLYDSYEREVKKLEMFLKLFKQDLISVDIEKRENGDIIETTLFMNYGDYRIYTEFESNGIKKLIKIFNYMNYAATGGIVFIDEMDSNINDIYLTKLVEFFMEYGEGQLCFTTHNTSPMTVLRKNKKSIDFLSNDNKIISWITNGNFAPDKLYKQGMIEYLPFNIEPEDFVGILGE